MERKKTVRLRDMLHLYWQEHPELFQKRMEARIKRLWGELCGSTIEQYTTKVFVRNRTLYVTMSSSVARNEMSSIRKQIVTALNKKAGVDVIDDVVIR